MIDMPKFFLSIILAVCGVVMMFSCAGQAARDNATLPAMREAWKAIRVEANREAVAKNDGISATELTKADAAMASGDVPAILAVNWPLLTSLAETDIVRRVVAHEIGEGAAASLREELRLFSVSRNTYTRTP